MKGITFRDLITLPCLLSLSRVPLGIAMIVLWQMGFPKPIILQPGLLGALTDFLDGHLARKRNQCTRAGQLLDPLCDKFLIASAAVVVFNEIEFWPAVITAGFELVFIVTPIVAVFGTEENVASMWPGKARVNAQCAALITFYLSHPGLGNRLLYAAIPFSILTVAFGIKKILTKLDQTGDKVNKARPDT